MSTEEVITMENRILEAAKQVFVRKGYEATKMGDVAAEAGIGRTALHYYYRTKEMLFDAIFDQLIDALLPNLGGDYGREYLFPGEAAEDYRPICKNVAEESFVPCFCYK